MARELPLEKHDTFDQGRLVTRGSECLPTSLTIGTMLNVLKSYPQNGHKHALFMPTAQGPCRFGQYCVLHKQILDREGHHDVFILSPSSINSYQGLEDELRRTMFKGLVAGDILLKARCKIRPYEINQGETDKIAEEHKLAIAKAIESGNDIEGALRKAIQSLSKVKIQGPQKPLVGIVGEIYIRNNQFGNENLIDAIEKFGGEVWMTPISEWILYTSSPLSFMQYLDKVVSKKALKSYLTYKWQKHWEHRLYKVCSPLLDDRREPAIATVLRGGLKYMPMNIGGEAISIIGRAIEYAKQGASLVVNCAPFGCMPGTVTTALFRKISKEISLPVVNLFYDGTGNENKRLAVYLNNSIKK
jgi:predicted nucleotide-binding protein (sugar kinase/HSP70/actin superfamily)